jgi:hypothetical protein
LDREIRVGVPARRADGPGRRTAGRWVAPPAVATVRFSGLRVVGRDSLERDSGKPWEFLGALMTPRGPIGREQAGSPASHPDGALGGCPSQSSGHPQRAPGPGSATCQGGTRPAASAVPVPEGHRSSLSEPTHLSALLAVDLPVSRCRRTAGSGPVFAHHSSAAPARRELAGRLLARVPAIPIQRP